MRRLPLACASILLVLCLLIAGCTQPAAQPQTPSGTPVPSTPVPVFTPPAVQSLPTAQTCSLVPGETRQPPVAESVSVTVDRNTIAENPTITTTFNGGQGLGMVERMDVTVIRSDCVTEHGTRANPGMGASVTLMGTTATDRVMVVMTMTSGLQYTVIDKDYPFPKGM
ncbi:MAG: hypothetical protein WC015_01760 [Methanoregula sp.]|nr:hypothetical protein [Methanoregula sp.]